ncbi:MAG: hypothetical protein M3R37_06240 [Actinomycetota bacterium]|nr:hypothetical protein [Actinomycetota bacterium]
MHVLRLPFGLALALIPRRAAEKLRDDEPMRVRFEKTVHAREKILGDIKHFDAGRYII